MTIYICILSFIYFKLVIYTVYVFIRNKTLINLEVCFLFIFSPQNDVENVVVFVIQLYDNLAKFKLIYLIKS